MQRDRHTQGYAQSLRHKPLDRIVPGRFPVSGHEPELLNPEARKMLKDPDLQGKPHNPLRNLMNRAAMSNTSRPSSQASELRMDTDGCMRRAASYAFLV